MPIGAPGTESFERAIVTCRNTDIAVLLAPLMIFRQELVSNDELQDRGGMDDTSRNHFLTHLTQCDRVRRQVTYNPNSEDLGALIAQSIDAKEVIQQPSRPLGGDEVQGQAGHIYALPWAFDGSDPDFPARSQVKMVGPHGLLLLNALDLSIVQITRLESRHRSRFVTVMDSMRVYGDYIRIHGYLTQLAGDANRVDVANVLPSAEPLGPQSSPNRVNEVGGTVRQ